MQPLGERRRLDNMTRTSILAFTYASSAIYNSSSSMVRRSARPQSIGHILGAAKDNGILPPHGGRSALSDAVLFRGLGK